MSKIVVVVILLLLLKIINFGCTCELPQPITYRITDIEASYTAWVKGQKFIENFGKFQFSKITVCQQNIPVLCNQILRFGNTKEIYLIDCNLIEIQGGHYEFCGILNYFEISANPIRILKNFTFKEMKIKHLNLSYNAIEWIEPKTFDDNRFLEILNLRGNKLKIIHSDWFYNTNLLYKIDIGENQLWTLQNGAFKNLINHTFMCFILDHNSIIRVQNNFLNGFKLITQLNLHGNKISTLPAEFLRNLYAFDVQFGDNKLKTLPLSFFQKYPKILYLDLRKNKFSCKYLSAIKNYATYNKRTVFCSWEQCYSVLLDKKYSNWDVY